MSTGFVPNVVYAAADRLALPCEGAEGLPGAGLFPRYAPGLVLTQPGQRLRSYWRLPSFFLPRDGRPPLSYHEHPGRWTETADGTCLRSVGRGQEFVLDLDAYPEALPWAVSTVASHSGWRRALARRTRHPVRRGVSGGMGPPATGRRRGPGRGSAAAPARSSRGAGPGNGRRARWGPWGCQC